MTTTVDERRRSGLAAWLLRDLEGQQARLPGPMSRPTKAEHGESWWKVMCLTGVDYFSTLGYQPGIAAVAAGALSPLATIVLVVLTLLGALPVYRRVAQESPHGGGSLAMLADFLPRWTGKLTVLVLLGFAATDFIITMTLSAADGAAHLIANPYAPSWLSGHNMTVTMVLLALLAAIFLKGFKEAIGIAVGLVGLYLALNAVVCVVGILQVIKNRHMVVDWSDAMTTQHGSIVGMIGFSLLVFPKLALGMSGFETGVAVMPQITSPAGESEDNPVTRIRGARKLLTTAALIMSVFLVLTSFITVVLIKSADFQPGGAADGRALAFLAHKYLGDRFGTLYDVSTIAILWFAGASAMAGLLNLVPRYLPKYGMAPEWARAVRPLAIVLALISFAVTWWFNANVDAQGGAYATGVLVLITSAALAVTWSAARKQQRGRMFGFLAVTAVLIYTTILNIIEKPQGVQLAGLFVLAIILVSFASRIRRAFELRAIEVSFDEHAAQLIDDAASEGPLRIICHDIDEQELPARRPEVYRLKEAIQRDESHIAENIGVVFLEVLVPDASEFSSNLKVTAVEVENYRILQVDASAIPNSVAAIALAIRDRTGENPHIYFEWSEGNPLINLFRFVFIGEGEVAPVTREIIRRAVPDRNRRPHMHVDS